MNFLDSSVVTYLFDERDPGKTEVARRLVSHGIGTGGGIISYQVVQEVLNVLTTRFANPAPADRAAEVLEDVLMPMWRVMPSEKLYRRGMGVQSRYRYGFYDSLIIAAALEAGCKRLLTEDLQERRRIEGLTISNPFAAPAR